MIPSRQRLFLGYSLAVASTTLATCVRLAIEPQLLEQVPFVTYFPAVFITALYARLGPALLAVVLSSLAASHYFLPPNDAFLPTDASGWTAMVLFVFFGVAIAFLSEQMHRNSQRAINESEKFSVTLACIGDAVIVTDALANVTFLNGVAEELTGWTSIEAKGQPLDAVFRIINEQTRKTVESPAKHALREGAIVGLANHTVLIAKDGSERPIDDSAAPIRAHDSTVLGCVMVFRDVSERKRVEEIRARLAAIIESSDDAIIGKTLDGIVTSWNRAAERLYGYTADQMIGQPISLIVPPDKKDELTAIMDRLRQGEAIAQMETDRQCRDGSRRQVSLTISPIRGANGQIVGASTIARDISERVRMEEELRQVASDLARASQRKDEFLATLAHELRNPLAPIRTGLELLHRVGNEPEKIEEVRAMIERQTQQLITLVDDLMNASRITRGKLELRKRRVNLTNVLKSAIEACRPFIDEANHQLTVRLPESPIYLDADPNRLTQVISNLLTNAAKYTPESGQIFLTAECHGNEAVISVQDNGIGIASDMRDRVFEMFAQIEQPLEKSYTGLGIGLTLVRSLVEMHGGSVDVDSNGINQGSTFRIRLPVSMNLSVNEPSAVKTPSTAVLPKRRILVVDDNTDAADLLRAVLEMDGSEVATAADGREAIDVAAEFRPEIVLMDLGMPTMNGFEAARIIRKQPWGKEMVLVALTGWGQDEDRQKTDRAGFDHHVVKPIDPAMLEQLLANINGPTAKTP